MLEQLARRARRRGSGSGPAAAQILLRAAAVLLLLPSGAATTPRKALGKRANLWLSTADCCGHPGCGDLFDDSYGRSHGFNTSYFEALRPWAASLDGLLIDCGHRLSPTGTLTLPNSTQQRRLDRTTAAFAALNVSVMPMIFADYDHADLGLDALSGSPAVRAAFIATATREAAAHGYAGWNIDWEPCTGASHARECGNLSQGQKWPHIPGILNQLHQAMAQSAPGTHNPDGSDYPQIGAAGYACDVTTQGPNFSHCPQLLRPTCLVLRNRATQT
jgi:hypothetical protein